MRTTAGSAAVLALCLWPGVSPFAWPESPPSGPPAATGTVEGRVEIDAPRPRRVGERYLAGGSAASRTVQPIPAVAFIEGAAPAGTPSPTLRVAQEDTAFAPAVLVVPVGATVEFPNQDAFFHNVFSYSAAKRFDLGRYPRGESRSVRFDEPGIVKVYCEVHEFMRSVVVVAPRPVHATVAEDGRFLIPDVPAGRHRLTVWHPEKGSREVEVQVTSGATARVQVSFP